MDSSSEVFRQHLIDPVMCVRCGGCEDACPNRAISLVDINFVIDADLCDGSMACVAPCQTGAISHWRYVERDEPYSLAEQAVWDELPEQAAHLRVLAPQADSPLCVSRAPSSAAIPVVMTNLASNPAVGRIVSNVRVTPESVDADIHHIVIAIEDPRYAVLEGQSVGVIAPGVDEAGHPHHMRLYSVASHRGGEGGRRGHFAFTVKRIVSDADGNPHQGVCSNYLCDTQPGEKVALTGPFGETFLMPQAPSARLLMIATGTGIAPMRGFIEYSRDNGRANPESLLLFYGGRTVDELAYCDELNRLDGGELDLRIALSRAPDRPRLYVQDLLRQASPAVAGLLADPDGHVFVCGLLGLEAGVLSALDECCRDNGRDWNELHRKMLDEGRIHFETY